MTVKRVAKKPKYKVGQVVWRRKTGTYQQLTGVLKHYVLFGGWADAQSRVRPLTTREKG